VASQPGKQEPLSINPPAGSAQPQTQQQTTPAQPLPPAPPAYSQPPATPAAPAPVTATPPAPAPALAPTPATAVGQPPLVPAQGTVGSGKVELVGVIFFAHGSSALDGRDAQVLAQIAQLHKQYGGIIRVIGNASARTGNLDQVEHELANFEVSTERAGAVAAKLASYGVPSTSIIIEARSDSQPIYHEFMPTGEAGNRRAEIYLEY
jgi:outer membrane protein OmpA-like peptidoglycan-associated protein